MAKTTSNVSLTTTWTQIAAVNDTFVVSATADTIFVAYASSQPSASVIGHPVLANAIYSDYQTVEIAWARTGNSSGVVASVTIEA